MRDLVINMRYRNQCYTLGETIQLALIANRHEIQSSWHYLLIAMGDNPVAIDC